MNQGEREWRNLVDALDLESRGQPWGFESPPSHHLLGIVAKYSFFVSMSQVVDH